MPAQRRSNLIRRRRRVQDDGEEEEGGSAAAHEQVEDSQSEPSGCSAGDQDADADDSDLSGTDAPDSSLDAPDRPAQASNGPVKSVAAGKKASSAPSAAQPVGGGSFAVMKDTEAMMNGLQISKEESQEGEALDFEKLGDGAPAQPVIVRTDGQNENRRQDSFHDRKRREHEEYRKKRDSDPAFVPNRGNFFMHDTSRAQGPQPNGFRPFPGRGRGRGRNGVDGPFPPATAGAQTAEPTNSQWTHDLHETLMEPNAKFEPQPAPRVQPAPLTIPPGPSAAVSTHAVTAGAVRNTPPQPRSFSTTAVLGTVTARISLPGMKEPKVASVRVSQYAKLPNHRPPLRRDKPVRISLPEHLPRYIFPSVDRSFIFIPRALRPNQQGFGNRRGNRFGSGTGLSSRRTSIYGGSVYSPSVVASRRSSIARDFNRDSLVSPAGSIVAGQPVVRLPPGRTQHSTASGTPIGSAIVSGAGTPVSAVLPVVGYPLPQQPTYRENLPANMQVHQPRPQKAVSVAGIESPGARPSPMSQQQQQHPPPPPPPEVPFHQQVPQHLNGNVPRPDSSAFYPPGQQMAFPPHPGVGTPHSHIPERAIHAPAFQPFHQQQAFQPGFGGQPAYYYPNASQPQYGSGAVIAPMFVPSQQGGYVMPTIAPAAPQNVQPAATPTAPPSMVAYEQNGMVYYYDPSQLQTPAENYTMAPSMGPMIPGQEGYVNYYPQMPPGPVYYPQQ